VVQLNGALCIHYCTPAIFFFFFFFFLHKRSKHEAKSVVLLHRKLQLTPIFIFFAKQRVTRSETEAAPERDVNTYTKKRISLVYVKQ
jgi:hypothetical protein